MNKTLLFSTLFTLSLGGASFAQMDMPGMDHSKTPMPGSSASNTGLS